jgi:hypothetical protein
VVLSFGFLDFDFLVLDFDFFGFGFYFLFFGFCPAVAGLVFGFKVSCPSCLVRSIMFSASRLIILAAFTLNCSSIVTLTEAEKAKLDPALQKLLMEENISESDYDVSIRPDSTKEYGVIIRSSNVEDLRSVGIQVGSVVGDFITARVTVNELRRIVPLPTVHAVHNSTKNFPQK